MLRNGTEFHISLCIVTQEKGMVIKMENRNFISIVNKIFIDKGFKRKRNDFYMVGNNDLLVIVHVQKSVYGNNYYLNVCFSLIEYDDKHNVIIPSWRDTDTYDRIRNLAEEGELYVFEDSKLDSILYLEALKQSIIKNIDEYIIPVLSKGSSYILKNENLFPTGWLSSRMKKMRENFIQ